ncbi:MAG TPA: DUF4430 domain-containing protein [Solirubrobacteraceae bacterium]|nr:DUF4430 domain-containing protein [Solirubrobacteraceae bacterium]
MPRRVRTAVAALAVALAAALGCAGCGFGPGVAARGVDVRVTEGFGTTNLGHAQESKVTGTVMQALQRSFKVSTKYGGGFVESIDGHSGSSDRYDWFLYINGIQSPKGAASTQVHKGDHVWWDLHDWRATDSIPAVVGAFPEPFTNGFGGKRYPTIVECVKAESGPCNTVTNELSSFKIPVSQGAIGYGSGNDSIGVVVGDWQKIDGELAAELIKFGPGASGVYARFVEDGSKLELLDPDGKIARTFGPDTGIVAAVNGNGPGNSNAVPTWLITGTDAAGVTAAAKAFTQSRLADHFALVVHDGTDYPVPYQAHPPSS